MHQAALFRCLQRRGHLQGDVDRCDDIQRPQTANAVFERFALDQFHSIKELTGLLANAELIRGRHVRMSQNRRRARFAHEALPRFRAVRAAFGVYDFERDGAIQRFIDRPIRDSHRAMAELPYTAIGMMLDRVSTQLIRRRSECGITLLCLTIQTGSNQTGDATQIARGSRLNGRTAGLANTRVFANCRHQDSLLIRPRPASK